MNSNLDAICITKPNKTSNARLLAWMQSNDWQSATGGLTSRPQSLDVNLID